MLNPISSLVINSLLRMVSPHLKITKRLCQRMASHHEHKITCLTCQMVFQPLMVNIANSQLHKSQGFINLACQTSTMRDVTLNNTMECNVPPLLQHLLFVVMVVTKTSLVSLVLCRAPPSDIIHRTGVLRGTLPLPFLLFLACIVRRLQLHLQRGTLRTRTRLIIKRSTLLGSIPIWETFPM